MPITPSFGLFNGGFGFHFGATALAAMASDPRRLSAELYNRLGLRTDWRVRIGG